MTHEEIIAAVESMTVLELADLVKAMEEKFGVSAAAPAAAMMLLLAPLLAPLLPLRKKRPSSTWC